NQVELIPALGNLNTDLVIIAGYDKLSDINEIRQLFSAIAAKIKGHKLSSISIELQRGSFKSLIESAGVVKTTQAMIEGLKLALYERSTTKKEPQQFVKLDHINFNLNEEQLREQHAYEAGVLIAEQLIQGVEL